MVRNDEDRKMTIPHNIRQRMYKERHPDRVKNSQNLYRKKNPEKFLNYVKNQYKVLGNDMSLNWKRLKMSLSVWGKTIKKRDNMSCVICGSKEKLHAHHIFPKSTYRGLMFNVNNGITLCNIHHRELHKLNGNVI